MAKLTIPITVNLDDIKDRMAKGNIVEVVRCKDCKHKPKGTGANHDLVFPDNVCPCQNPEDGWYSWKLNDDWFCADAERKEE